MLLYLTSKRQKSVWKSEYMETRKTDGEFVLTSEFCDKQFTDYVLPDGRTASIFCSSILNVT